MISNIIYKDRSDVYRCGVYKLYHINIPDFIYIGSTSMHLGKKNNIGFQKRFSSHLSLLRSNKHKSKLLQVVYNRFGETGLKMEIIEVCNCNNVEFIRNREQFYIDQLKPKYNTFKNSRNASGYKHTEVSKLKISIANTGRKHNAETRRKISIGHKGHMPKNFGMLQSEGSRKKRSHSLKGIKRSSKAFFDNLNVPVYQFSKFGILIKHYPSIKSAALETGTDRTGISKSIKDFRLKANGFYWSSSDHLPDLFFEKTCVLKIGSDEEIIEIYETIQDAKNDIGVSSHTSIRGAICGMQKMAYGYKWKRIMIKDLPKSKAIQNHD